MKPLTERQIINNAQCPSCKNKNPNWSIHKYGLLTDKVNYICNVCSLEIYISDLTNAAAFYHKNLGDPKLKEKYVIQWIFYDRNFFDNTKTHTNIIAGGKYMTFDKLLPFDLTEKNIESYLCLL